MPRVTMERSGAMDVFAHIAEVMGQPPLFD